MSNLDAVLTKVWDETSVQAQPAVFNAVVFEQIARRRVQREFGVAALLALAVWAITLGLFPVVTPVFSQLGGLIGSGPVLTAASLILAGLGLVVLLRLRLPAGWWRLGFRA